MKLFSISIFLFFSSLANVYAQTPIPIPGTATSISGVINSYAEVTQIYYSCPDSIVVTSTSGFSPGDSILIIQMQGAIIDSTNTNSFGSIIDFNRAGNFELVRIDIINGNTIILRSSLLNTYDPSSKVQIVSYPSFASAVVSDTLTAPAWNGSTGGVLAFSVQNTLYLASDIDMTGKGFSGGNTSIPFLSTWSTGFSFGISPGEGGMKGDGICGYRAGSECGRAPNTNGGGGGMCMNTGGAGGSNYGGGGHGGNNEFAPDTLWGMPGIPLDTGVILRKMFMGGGGGGGHQDNGQGTGGSNGGGIILIHASTIQGNGYSIKSNGRDVSLIAVSDGAGGGGGGGSILLNVETFDLALSVEARGGKGGDQVNPLQCYGNGGGGGGGVLIFGDTILPSNVFVSVSGGSRGSGQCNGTSNDAADGDSGIVVLGWTYPTVVTANAGPDVNICAGQIVQIGTPAVSGMQYIWSNGSTVAQPNITSLIDTSLVLTVTDGSCHYNYDTVYVSVWPDPVPQYLFNVSCSDVTFSNNPGGYTYKWHFGDGDSSSAANPSHTYLNSGTYIVDLTIRDLNGCTTNTSQAITINTNQQPSMSYTNGNCDSVFYFMNQSINPVISRWRFGDGDSSNALHATHTYRRSGAMNVQLITTSQNGCVDTIYQNVFVVIRVPAKFEHYIDSCAAKVFFNSKSPLSVAYHWDFGDNSTSILSDPVHTYQEEGEYSVTLTVNAGTTCSELMNFTVHSPADGLYTIYIPNSFTPNGDGINDEFKIYSKIPCDSYQLRIFDRWGGIVFSTDDPLNYGWNGFYSGNPVPEGVYAWKLQGTKSQMTGVVVISR